MATSRRPAKLCLGLSLVLVLAVHIGLAWLAITGGGRQMVGDELRYTLQAQRLLNGVPIEVDLLQPPLYRWLLAFLTRLTSDSMPVVLTSLQLLLHAGCALITSSLAGRMGCGAAGRWTAGLSVMALPSLAAYAHYRWPETLHLFLFLVTLWLISRRHRRSLHLTLAGAALGLALLTKSLLTPFVPIILGFVAWTASSTDPRSGGVTVARAGRRWRDPLWLLLTLVATVAPTLATHYATAGHWVIADSSTFNLWVGLNDPRAPNHVDSIVAAELADYSQSADSPAARDALLRQRIAGLVDDRGVITVVGQQLTKQYFRLFDKSSFFSLQLPGGSLYQPGEHGYQGLSKPTAFAWRQLDTWSYSVLLVLAAFGLAALGTAVPGRANGPKRDGVSALAWLLLAFLAYNLILFLGLHVKTRYRLPMLPVLVIFASLAVDHWRAGAQWPVARRWLAASIATVLLLLAWAGPLVWRASTFPSSS